jgi:UDP-N-acetylmuramoyl-L-alanyl-D-glutamate--2,6-diaminopimelate ligase
MMPKQQNKIVAVLNRFGINLADIFSDNTTEGLLGDLHNDSRAIKSGDIFCAIIGSAQDGRVYTQIAVNNGASLIISECESELDHGKLSRLKNTNDKEIIVVNFYQLNNALFSLSKLFYGNPQSQMSMIGITGTNGKTSTSQLLGQLLSSLNMPCGIIGTNGYGLVDALTPLNNTTPSATDLHQIFSQFIDNKVTCVAMEASSHALEQGRVYADLFDIALFTNLSRDHLDYHSTMAEYAAAKKRIFTGDSSQIAVLNGDDKQAQQWLNTWPAQQIVWVFGKEKQHNANQYYVQASNIVHSEQGVSFTLNTHLGNIEINSPLLGDFNVDNLLAAISVLMIQHISIEQIAEKIKGLSPIAGRMESTSLTGHATTVVDYAHTPDALEKALMACKQHCHGNLWVVFGCGGDRDKGKRPLMTKAANQIADFLVITSDNPRTENAQVIVDDMMAELDQEKRSEITVILDREQAVLSTLKSAQENDIVLLAGKGHENYIIMGNETIEYNEREIVANYYNTLAQRKASL